MVHIGAILGLTAVVAPQEAPPAISARDIWVMLTATAALALVAWTGRRINRAEGAVMVVACAGYLGRLVAAA